MRVVFEEPFGRPRLACGFDFLGEVFTAGDVSERCHYTSFMSRPVNEDHQDKSNDHLILTLRLCLFVHPNTKATCQSTYTNTYKLRRFDNILKVFQEANKLLHSLIYEECPNHHHYAWKYSIFVNYRCRRYKPFKMYTRR